MKSLFHTKQLEQSTNPPAEFSVRIGTKVAIIASWVVFIGGMLYPFRMFWSHELGILIMSYILLTLIIWFAVYSCRKELRNGVYRSFMLTILVRIGGGVGLVLMKML